MKTSTNLAVSVFLFGYISSVPHPRSQGYEPPLRTTYPPVVEFLRRHAFSAFIFAVFLGTAVLLGLLVNPLCLGIDWVFFFAGTLWIPRFNKWRITFF